MPLCAHLYCMWADTRRISDNLLLHSRFGFLLHDACSICLLAITPDSTEDWNKHISSHISLPPHSTSGRHDPSVSIPVLLLQHHIHGRLTQPQPEQPSGRAQLWSPGQPGQATNHGGLLLKNLLSAVLSPLTSCYLCPRYLHVSNAFNSEAGEARMKCIIYWRYA